MRSLGQLLKSPRDLIWTSVIVLSAILLIAGLRNGLGVFILAAIAIPWAALLLIGNSLFGPSPIKDCKWQHFGCFVVLSLSISFLLLAGSGVLETIDVGGNKVAFVRQQVKDIKLLAENVADLALLTTKTGLGSGSVDWTGPDIRVIAETRDRT